MGGQKHDNACLHRRREDARYLFVCTCDMTDEQVRDAERYFTEASFGGEDDDGA